MQPPAAVAGAPSLTNQLSPPRRARSGTIAARPPAPAGAPLAPLPAAALPDVGTPFVGSSQGAAPASEAVAARRLSSDEGERDGEGDDEEHPASPTLQRLSLSMSPDRPRTVHRARTSETGQLAAGGGATRRRRKWLVLVVPPSSLPHDPPPAATSGFANGYGPVGRFNGGILMALQPTLASQVSLIAREYGLPSVAGMCLYLALPTTGSQTTQMTEYLNAGGWSLPSPALGGTDAAPAGFKPRVTEEFWPALWSDFLVDDGIAESMAGVGSLPIAGRIEFDFDPRRARWLDEWRALPSATSESVASAHPPLSPALSLRLERPRYRTSSSYVRPMTPAMSDVYVSQVQGTDDDEHGPSGASDTFGGDDGLSAPATPRTSTPRTSFESHRPLSLVSQAASVQYRPQSRSASVTSARSSGTEARPASRIEPGAATPRSSAVPVHLGKPLLNDSGFDEGTASPVVARQVPIPPPEPSPITLTASGSTFAFPRPLPRNDSPFLSGLEPETDWTTQLDRLREISETSLLDGVDHPSRFGSVDTSANETLGEFLLSIVGETVPPTPPRYEDEFASGIYPLRGLYGLAQPSVVLPPSLTLVTVPVADGEPKSVPLEQLASTPPVGDKPASTPPQRAAPVYPSLILYPAVYPRFDLYPPPAASLSAPPAVALLSDPALGVVRELYEPSAWPDEPATPSGYVDDDPFASSFGRDSPTSPVLGSSSDGMDDFLESYTHEGRPLSSITEVTEQLTSGSSRTWSGQVTPAAGTPDALGGSFGELHFEDRDDTQWATEPLALPDILLDAAAGTPRLTYSSPTGSIASTTLDPADLAHQQSPLPSPTITPARPFPAPLPLASREAADEDDSDEDCEATAHDDEDYTLEVTETLYSGTFDSPYIVSPGLQAALGLDDSPQLAPVQFDDEDDDREEYDVGGAFDSEDSLSEDGSQYSGRGGSTRLAADGERDPGDQCLTLDRFTLSQIEPVQPVLFSFPPLTHSRDLLDALALFIVEAQVQSVDRRGAFRIALGGGILPELLARALVEDERIEWDKWEIFFASNPSRADSEDGTPLAQRFVTELFPRVPVCSGKVHVFYPGEDADVGQEYEDQLAEVFEPEEGETPRFDLVLLGAADLAVVSCLDETGDRSRWVVPLDPDSSSPTVDVALAPSLLSAARRLAFLLPSTSARDALACLLAADPPGYVQLASQQPVVLFTDEDAAGEVEWERARFWDVEEEEAAP